MTSINATKLKEMFIGGKIVVGKNYEYINELNVFPVPDGDTGSNMKITIDGACNVIEANDYEDLYTLGKQFSRGLLMNARGNSGVIFSQIIKGFTGVFKEGQKELIIPEVIAAFENAKNIAYHAVNTPVEGTILTVIRVVSEKLKENKNSFKSIEELFEFA